jgi:hypothetical protein
LVDDIEITPFGGVLPPEVWSGPHIFLVGDYDCESPYIRSYFRWGIEYQYTTAAWRVWDEQRLGISHEAKYYLNFAVSNDYGKTWGAIHGPFEYAEGSYSRDGYTVDYYPTDTLERTSYGITHKIFISDGDVFYQRKENEVWSSAARLTENVNAQSVSFSVLSWPWPTEMNYSIIVSWQAGGHIYTQMVPYNYAPVKGTSSRMFAIINPISSEVAGLTSALEAPTLVDPTNNKQDVASLRPTFKWQHTRSNQLPVTSYQLDIAKNDSFGIDLRSFSLSSNNGSLDKNSTTVYNYNYSIHEFDQGLDADTDYYWKVTALTTSEAATSEVWSFRIAPNLTLTDVANYPNPFNPNRENTKIRYRLGADADEVKIRIYDLTGRLVKELDGTTQGEEASIWDKYNDVEWDGRNGRGDKVVNGIYPFEVVARLGDRSVCGRGKVAVLK